MPTLSVSCRAQRSLWAASVLLIAHTASGEWSASAEGAAADGSYFPGTSVADELEVAPLTSLEATLRTPTAATGTTLAPGRVDPAQAVIPQISAAELGNGKKTKSLRLRREGCERVEAFGCRCQPGRAIACQGLDRATADALVDTFSNVTLRELILYNISTTFTSSLCKLNFNEFVIANSTLSSLGQVRDCKFSSFVIDNTTFEKTDKLFHELREVSTLTKLSFMRTHVGMTGIDQLSHLESLNFFMCNLTIGEHLRHFDKLRELQIIRSNTDTKKINRSQLPVAPERLRLLRLSGIGLYSVPDNVIAGMPLLEKLDLSYNHLVTLEPSALVSFHGTILMHGNPWHCDELKWLKRRIVEASLKLFSPIRVACATPPGTFFDEIELEPEKTKDDWLETPRELILTNRSDLVPPVALCFIGGTVAALGMLWLVTKVQRRRRLRRQQLEQLNRATALAWGHRAVGTTASFDDPIDYGRDFDSLEHSSIASHRSDTGNLL